MNTITWWGGGGGQQGGSSHEKLLQAWPRSSRNHFSFHSIEKKLVTWPPLSARDNKEWGIHSPNYYGGREETVVNSLQLMSHQLLMTTSRTDGIKRTREKNISILYSIFNKNLERYTSKTNHICSLLGNKTSKSPSLIFQEILNYCDSLRLTLPHILSSAYCISFQSCKHSPYSLEI